jgi:cytochrome c oxidase assembly protein subunit 15
MKPEGGLSSSLIPHPSSFSVWPHRLALILACATFPLLFIGGLVTGKGAGLAVPDWPTTFGYNMFLYPWSKMVGGIFYEHSHRLVASTVGLLTIVLASTLWFKERRNWLRWLGVAALVMVIIQGVLGGLRVVLLEHMLAIVHAGLAQAFFALTASLALFTSAEWSRPSAEEPLNDNGKLSRLCALTTGLIYVQVVFGAVVRHTGDRVDAHLFFAALVALHVIFILLRVVKYQAHRPKLVGPAKFLGLLLLIQMLLGTGSFFGKFTPLLRLPMESLVLLTTTHLVVGALMLVTSLLLTLRSYRYSAVPTPPVREKVLTEQFSL